MHDETCHVDLENPTQQTLQANSETNITNLENPGQQIFASTPKSRNRNVTQHIYTEKTIQQHIHA